MHLPILLTSIVILFSSTISAQEKEMACDFPVPHYRIGQAETTGISKASFQAVITKALSVYSPIFEARRCPLVIHPLWSDGTINAQAYRYGGKCHVDMFGGFARFQGITTKAFAAILCHEIGHHLGGAPTYTGMSWASVEGQSDYYATRDCMRRLGYSSGSASLALATALAKLSGEARLPSRNDRATEKVSRTLESHPRAQCRLDTMDRGRAGSSRPRCWFKP